MERFAENIPESEIKEGVFARIRRCFEKIFGGRAPDRAASLEHVARKRQCPASERGRAAAPAEKKMPDHLSEFESGLFKKSGLELEGIKPGPEPIPTALKPPPPQESVVPPPGAPVPLIQMIQKSKPTGKVKIKRIPTFARKEHEDEESARLFLQALSERDPEEERKSSKEFEALLAASFNQKDVQDALREKKAPQPNRRITSEIIKGYPNSQAELDLHGQSADQAEQSINSFIADSIRERRLTVRIITGKGLHSQNGESRLRDVAENRVIALKAAGQILTFRWENGNNKQHSGAMIVYLNR